MYQLSLHQSNFFFNYSAVKGDVEDYKFIVMYVSFW